MSKKMILMDDAGWGDLILGVVILNFYTLCLAFFCRFLVFQLLRAIPHNET